MCGAAKVDELSIVHERRLHCQPMTGEKRRKRGPTMAVASVSSFCSYFCLCFSFCVLHLSSLHSVPPSLFPRVQKSFVLSNLALRGFTMCTAHDSLCPQTLRVSHTPSVFKAQLCVCVCVSCHWLEKGCRAEDRWRWQVAASEYLPASSVSPTAPPPTPPPVSQRASLVVGLRPFCLRPSRPEVPVFPATVLPVTNVF